MKRIEVVVVDDSPICRARLREILEVERDIHVAGEAASGEKALELLSREKPSLLLLDLNMPRLSGLETVERVMASHPLPILVVTGQPGGKRQDAVYDAIRRGALDLAEKPGLSDMTAQRALRSKVRQLAGVPVIHHVSRSKAHDVSPAAAQRPAAPRVAPTANVKTVVGIGASAGGPTPLVQILGALPKNYAGSIAVVQHLPIGFARSFADFVQGRIALKVVVVTATTRIEPGVVYLAADDRHLVAEDRSHFTATFTPAIDGHRPAATTLFQSLAKTFGAQSIGVVLSGMGRDGVVGLQEMRAKGALTLAQDMASAAVFGMPRAAIEAGVISKAVAPAEIARILEKERGAA